MPRKRPDLLDRLSPDDPRYDKAKHFYLTAWADSYGLVADVSAGKVSLHDYVEVCLQGIAQGMQLQVALREEPVSQRCRELDRVAKRCISAFNKAFPSGPRGLSEATRTTVKEHFSRRVREIVARSKQQIFEQAREELAATKAPTDRATTLEITAEPGPSAVIDDGVTYRRALVETYIQEVFQKSGKRITRTEIWKAARDKTRTEFERWESYWYEKRGRKGNATANERFMRVLKQKPHM